MPAPLTAQQIALSRSKRRAGSRQEVAAAAAGISVGRAHRHQRHHRNQRARRQWQFLDGDDTGNRTDAHQLAEQGVEEHQST